MFKKILPDLIAILAFILISLAYFFPAVMEGRVLAQHDSVAGIGSGIESKDYYERTGERTRWTNALFGGMPTYQMAPSYPSTDTLKVAENAYHLYLPNYVWLVFVMLLGFYILLRAMTLSAWLSALGAVIWAFSSYFFIIIAAGHIWKFVTLAYIVPTIAGIVLAYRGKYLWGGILTAIFVALQIMSNHIQMSYYFLFVIFFMVIAFFVDAYRKKQLPQFLKATATVAAAGIIGIAVNASTLYHTYEYSKETIRGKSELTTKDQKDQTKNGLGRDYIVQWSYGIGETASLLVPNVKGGASVPLALNKKAMKDANPMYVSLYQQLGQYWGEQPGTSGPVYVGAFVMLLFILGLFIVRTPMKWALFAATVLSILLSWGKNFMGFTDFFLDFVPMYDKFRAVSSILVIAEFTIPLLAILTLKQLIDQPQLLKQERKYIWISFGLTGGLALVFAVLPRLFFPSYVSSGELAALQSGIPQEHLGAILNNLEEMRIGIFTADAWRSFFIILIGTAVLFAFDYKKISATGLIIGITALCLIDMWSVNKRYLKDSDFIANNKVKVTFQQTETDKFILNDKTLDYRVLNLASNTFNENNTSYWHKSIGGYHAAKLRRYQEMIDHHISQEMYTLSKAVGESKGDMSQVDPTLFPVLNMLNTRYFIFAAEQGKTVPIFNPYALGNAWFVDQVKYVQNADEEIALTGAESPAKVAIVDRKFEKELGGLTQLQTDSLSRITLKSYEPNKLVYETENPQEGIAVFSEIYYPGWRATIDGKEVEIARADYILRALKIPAGKHTIEFVFDPRSLHLTETIAFIALGILTCVILFAVFIAVRNRKQQKHNKEFIINE